MPQFVPSQVAVPFEGTLHAEHELPQFATLLLATHAAPHRWKPVLHVKSHVVPLHVEVALAGGTHGVHEPPQVATLALLAHAPAHAW